ncbi:hypothetical protein ACFX14_046882 [Malus domestica]
MKALKITEAHENEINFSHKKKKFEGCFVKLENLWDLGDVLVRIDVFDGQLAVLEEIKSVGGHTAFAGQAKANLVPYKNSAFHCFRHRCLQLRDAAGDVEGERDGDILVGKKVLFGRFDANILLLFFFGFGNVRSRCRWRERRESGETEGGHRWVADE